MKGNIVKILDSFEKTKQFFSSQSLSPNAFPLRDPHQAHTLILTDN